MGEEGAYSRAIISLGCIEMRITVARGAVPESGFHKNAYLQFGIVLRGRGTLETETKVDLRPLSFFVIQRLQPHAVSLEPGYLDLTLRVV